MIAAAKAVHAHDFIIELPDGYDTEISERGARLSNGQRQLLAFARTMVSIRGLILDEAHPASTRRQKFRCSRVFRAF